MITLGKDVILGALQLSVMLDKPIYICILTSGHHNFMEKPLLPNVRQWRVYPIGQLELHTPVTGANEYFFQTIERNLEIPAIA